MAYGRTGLLLSAGLALSFPASALAAAPPECSPSDMVGLSEANTGYYVAGDHPGSIDRVFAKRMVSDEGIDGRLHGVIARSEIDYSFDSVEPLGFALKFVVGVDGRVTCLALAPQWNTQRRAWAETVSEWRFKPYLSDGKPVAAIGQIDVREYEQPKTHGYADGLPAPPFAKPSDPLVVPAGHLMPAVEGLYQPGPHRFPEYHGAQRSDGKGD